MFLNGLRDRLGRRKGARGLERPPPARGPRDAGVGARPLPLRDRCRERRSGNVVIDKGSFKPSAGAASSVAARCGAAPTARSATCCMVSGRRSATGQAARWSAARRSATSTPASLLELDLKGPGWQARGAAFGAVPRLHPDRARARTTRGRSHRRDADIIDQYVEQPAAARAVARALPLQGQVPADGRLRRRQAPAGGGEKERQIKFMQDRARAGGRATRRCAAGRTRGDLTQALELRPRDTVDQFALLRPARAARVRSAKNFFRAASQTPQTFNSYYVDRSDIAIYTSGRLPLRGEGRGPGPADRWHAGATSGAAILSAKAHPQGR